MKDQDLKDVEILNKRRTPALRLGFIVAVVLILTLPQHLVPLSFLAWLLVYWVYMYLTKPVPPDE